MIVLAARVMMVGCAEGGVLVDALRVAYCEVMRQRSVWRGAKDVEAQIAHWCIEGVASHTDLVAARQAERTAHLSLQRAQRVYSTAATRAVTSSSLTGDAGMGAGLGAGVAIGMGR